MELGVKAQTSARYPWDDPEIDVWEGVTIETPEEYDDYLCGLWQEPPHLGLPVKEIGVHRWAGEIPDDLG